MRVAWADPAVDDLTSIHAFISRDSEHYARQFVNRILDAAETLSLFPRRGRLVPEARDLPDVRELFFHSYRIIYRIESSRVLVLAVVHGSRDLTRLDKKPW